MKTYKALLEIQRKQGISRVAKTVKAVNLDKAWTEAQKAGGKYNKTHKNKCVVYSVTLMRS
jgi:hypothetical protein